MGLLQSNLACTANEKTKQKSESAPTKPKVAVDKSKVRTKALKGTVALTFDDGPSTEFTPQVLDILKRYNVKATFFVMGWSARDYPHLIKRMIDEGHAVAHHTNAHKNLTKLTDKDLRHEISMPLREITKSLGGIKPVCLRPPFGASNKHVKKMVESYGLIHVGIGFNTFDYDLKRSKQELINWVVSNAKSKRVFCMHDGLFKKQKTVDALPAIIEGIRKKGLGFSRMWTLC